jgi:nucleoside-diphosphate-sugar epimerase
MKKYVVTGGAGFIGSALIRGLLERGDGQLIVIDNLITGFARNLDDLSDVPRFLCNRSSLVRCRHRLS